VRVIAGDNASLREPFSARNGDVRRRGTIPGQSPHVVYRADSRPAVLNVASDCWPANRGAHEYITSGRMSASDSTSSGVTPVLPMWIVRLTIWRASTRDQWSDLLINHGRIEHTSRHWTVRRDALTTRKCFRQARARNRLAWTRETPIGTAVFTKTRAAQKAGRRSLVHFNPLQDVSHAR